MDRLTQYQKILAGNPTMAAVVRRVCFPPDDPVAVASACVLGPALGSFTQWLLANAMARGVRRLYFLARDGYLMRQAGEILCQTLGLPVDCRYLYCSRYALRLPNFHRDQNQALDFLCRDATGITSSDSDPAANFDISYEYKTGAHSRRFLPLSDIAAVTIDDMTITIAE